VRKKNFHTFFIDIYSTESFHRFHALMEKGKTCKVHQKTACFDKQAALYTKKSLYGFCLPPPEEAAALYASACA